MFNLELEDLFSEGEREMLLQVTENSIDVEELEKTGKVKIEFKEEEGDFITKIVHYESFDGNRTLTKEVTFPKNEMDEFRLKELEELKAKAIEEEKYEKASKFKEEEDAIVSRKK